MKFEKLYQMFEADEPDVFRGADRGEIADRQEAALDAYKQDMDPEFFRSFSALWNNASKVRLNGQPPAYVDKHLKHEDSWTVYARFKVDAGFQDNPPGVSFSVWGGNVTVSWGDGEGETDVAPGPGSGERMQKAVEQLEFWRYDDFGDDEPAEIIKFGTEGKFEDVFLDYEEMWK